MDVIRFSADAVLPVVLTMLFGSAFRKLTKWNEEFFKELNKLCFRLFLPLNMFYNIYAIERLDQLNFRLVLFIWAMTLVICVLGIIVAKAFPENTKGSLVQAAFRSNLAIMGIPLAEALGGAEAIATSSLATGLTVPLYNVLAVFVLTAYSGGERRIDLKSMLKKIARNPLIIGSLSGIAVLIIRSWIPHVDGVPVFSIKQNLSVIYVMLGTLSKVASPVMLFSLGARLNFAAVKTLKVPLFVGNLMRLILAPVIGIGGAIALKSVISLTIVEVPTLAGIFATPVAISSAVMVQEIGGDDQYASQLVVWTSIFSIFTLFITVSVLRASGWL